MAFRHYISLQHTIDEETLCRENNTFRMTFKDIRRGATNLQIGLLDACTGGHINLVQLMTRSDRD